MTKTKTATMTLLQLEEAQVQMQQCRRLSPSKRRLPCCLLVPMMLLLLLQYGIVGGGSRGGNFVVVAFAPSAFLYAGSSSTRDGGRWRTTNTNCKQRSLLTVSLKAAENDIIHQDSSASSFLDTSTMLTEPGRAYVELIDPETNCQVILLGCFHGSQSSAADVRNCLASSSLTQPKTNVVVLELCASRFADIRKHYMETKRQPLVVAEEDQQETGQPDTIWDGKNSRSSDEALAFLASAEQQTIRRSAAGAAAAALAVGTQSKKKRSWVQRYVNMVQTTFVKKGLSTAAAAALLGGVSGIQTSLAGLEPGLEFTTALDVVVKHNENNKNNKIYDDNDGDMDIVLADQAVDETLQKIGEIPRLSFQLWKDFLQNGWGDSFGRESNALSVALLGDSKLQSSSLSNSHYQITLWAFLTRSSAAVFDLARLILPPVILFQTLNALLGEILSSGGGATADETTMAFSAVDAGMIDPVVVTTLLKVWLNTFLSGAFVYLTLALPATKVILRERDDQLARGIQAACRLAAQNAHKTQTHLTTTTTNCEKTPLSGRVVAVLGLLHVNGVAQRLLSSSSSTTTTTTDELE